MPRLIKYLCILTLLVTPLLAAEPQAIPAAEPQAIPAAEPQAIPVAEPQPLSLQASYRVNVTSQPYSFYFPWQKKTHVTRSGMGVVIGPNQILVTANLVQDHTYAELQHIRTGTKQSATVVCVDYEANLAIIQSDNPAFLEGSRALQISGNLGRNAPAVIWQFEDDGAPVITEGQLRRAVVTRYPHGEFLLYELNANLPGFARPQGTPIVADDKLVGLMLHYNSNNQTVRLVPPEIIRHFLDDFADGEYQGFPQAGFGFTRLDDPQLRAFVKLPQGEQGVYITYVQPNAPAAEAGMQKGDVLLKIDAYDVDRLGLYDDPDHGKLAISHISTTRSGVGRARTYHVWRDEKQLELNVKLRRICPTSYPIPPYVYDRGPDYVIAGGLVFLELSQQFLQEWGREWEDKAPPQLVHYDRNQWELFEPGSKLVILARVLKTPNNGGYDNLNFRVLTEVNGKPITRLTDVPKALETPIAGGFHSFLFDHAAARRIILDAQAMHGDNADLKHHVGQLQRLTESGQGE